MWDSITGHIDSPAELAGQWFILHDINNRGDVVGHAVRGASRSSGIGPQARRTSSTSATFALGINDRGQIVGEIRFELEEPAHTVLWDDYTAAPQVFADFRADPTDINNRGQIAGIQGFGADAYRCVRDTDSARLCRCHRWQTSRR